MECNHRIKQFVPLDEGYKIICLKCNQIIKEEHGLAHNLIEIQKMIYLLGEIAIQTSLAIEAIRKSGILDNAKNGT